MGASKNEVRCLAPAVHRLKDGGECSSRVVKAVDVPAPVGAVPALESYMMMRVAMVLHVPWPRSANQLKEMMCGPPRTRSHS